MSEAILPAYQYEEDQSAIAGGLANNPSRLNPRMPTNAKKAENAEDFDELFDEGQGGDPNKVSLLSLINDAINRTPMDLIQADFPSTPSSVYSSKRIFDPELSKEQQEQLKVDTSSGGAAGGANAPATATAALMSNTSLNTTTSSAGSTTEGSPGSNSQQLALDQATKSLEQLYVNPVSKQW